ncbi:hypothetical protein KIPB_012667, partial [Kipferlia bialata]|eukprot:g12667.t1
MCIAAVNEGVDTGTVSLSLHALLSNPSLSPSVACVLCTHILGCPYGMTSQVERLLAQAGWSPESNTTDKSDNSPVLDTRTPYTPPTPRPCLPVTLMPCVLSLLSTLISGLSRVDEEVLAYACGCIGWLANVHPGDAYTLSVHAVMAAIEGRCCIEGGRERDACTLSVHAVMGGKEGRCGVEGGGERDGGAEAPSTDARTPKRPLMAVPPPLLVLWYTLIGEPNLPQDTPSVSGVPASAERPPFSLMSSTARSRAKAVSWQCLCRALSLPPFLQ